jgi:hypothetical protein
MAWQITDGPIVRWAYRDSSLRSYYLSQLTDERLGRGHVYLFRARGDTLQDSSGDPALTRGIAARAVLQGDRDVARGALRFHLGQWPDDASARYLLAWIAYAEDERAQSDVLLGTSGRGVDPAGSSAAFADARAALAGRDTADARAALARAITLDPYSPVPHALLAELSFGDPGRRTRLLLEAFATVALAPEDPRTWRRWAFVQASFGEMTGGLHSLARYRQLDPERARTDRAAAWLEGEMRRREPSAPHGGQLELD